jgi:hypothetical protein
MLLNYLAGSDLADTGSTIRFLFDVPIHENNSSFQAKFNFFMNRGLAAVRSTQTQLFKQKSRQVPIMFHGR